MVDEALHVGEGTPQIHLEKLLGSVEITFGVAADLPVVHVGTIGVEPGPVLGLQQMQQLMHDLVALRSGP